jgi:hypothetical protein
MKVDERLVLQRDVGEVVVLPAKRAEQQAVLLDHAKERRVLEQRGDARHDANHVVAARKHHGALQRCGAHVERAALLEAGLGEKEHRIDGLLHVQQQTEVGVERGEKNAPLVADVREDDVEHLVDKRVARRQAHKLASRASVTLGYLSSMSKPTCCGVPLKMSSSVASVSLDGRVPARVLA